MYGKPEILFFGPDEGTADMMDWASQYARSRYIFYYPVIYVYSTFYFFVEELHSGKLLQLGKVKLSEGSRTTLME